MMRMVLALKQRRQEEGRKGEREGIAVETTIVCVDQPRWFLSFENHKQLSIFVVIEQHFNIYIYNYITCKSIFWNSSVSENKQKRLRHQRRERRERKKERKKERKNERIILYCTRYNVLKLLKTHKKTKIAIGD